MRVLCAALVHALLLQSEAAVAADPSNLQRALDAAAQAPLQLLDGVAQRARRFSRHVEVTAQLPGTATDDEIKAALAGMEAMAKHFLFDDDAIASLLRGANADLALPPPPQQQLSLRGGANNAARAVTCHADAARLCSMRSAGDAAADAAALADCLDEHLPELAPTCAAASRALRESHECREDAATLCAHENPGDGRVHRCLLASAAQLTAACARAVRARAADASARVATGVFTTMTTVTRRAIRVRHAGTGSPRSWRHALRARLPGAVLLATGVALLLAGVWLLCEAVWSTTAEEEEEEAPEPTTAAVAKPGAPESDGVEMPYAALKD